MFKDHVTFSKNVDAYFLECNEKGKPYTLTSLAVYLGCDRETLAEYAKRPEFADSIKNARLKVEAYAEESLWQPKIAAGVIFNLKNNWGWKDKTEVEQSGELTLRGYAVVPQKSKDDVLTEGLNSAS